MMKNNTATVKRHSVLYRVLHWLIVCEVLVLLLSGLGVSDWLHLEILGRGASRSLHEIIGLFWTGTITFFLYYFIVSGEYEWFGIRRFGSSVDFFVHELKCFITGKKVKDPVGYDAERRKYLEKIVPTEVLAWWGWFALWMVMIFTGLALLFPGHFAMVNGICHFVFPTFENAIAATRLMHIFAAMVIVVYILIHAYACFTFGMIGSMFSGTKEEPLAQAKRP